ncbi:DUF685 domain-containing protein [Borrelia hispanica]|uniref:DUF685 domain-containing protein n=1 Tax=Borrelia hispanica TaxID=40835 RepID=UPI000467D336|nr:DUF685 domain-containing protein [Borrelia hispanica]
MTNQESPEQDTVVRHDDTIEIRNLNRRTSTDPSDLLVLDDGFSSCHAITFDDFRKELHKKTFVQGEGVDDFKQIIQTLIANELLQNTNFINQAYQKVIEKLKNNESSVMDSILSKVTNKLEYDLSQQDTLNTNTYFLGLYYSSLKKIKVQEHLTGISGSFSATSTTIIKPERQYSGEYTKTVYMSSLKYGRYVFDLSDSSQTNQNSEITIQTDSSYDDKPIYLIVKVEAISSSTSQANKIVNIKYSGYSSKRTLFQLSSVNGGTGLRLNILEGWYMQKNVGGNPLLLKL